MAQRLQAPEDISAAYFSLGNTARAQKDTATAIDCYQKAIATSAKPLAKVQAQINYLSLLTHVDQAAKAEQTNTALAALQLADDIPLATLPPSRESLFANH